MRRALTLLQVEKVMGWIVKDFRWMESIRKRCAYKTSNYEDGVNFSCFFCIMKGCFALKGSEETRTSAKTLGDTRVWTRDLSICSRMLYHWAISPYLSVDEASLNILIHWSRGKRVNHVNIDRFPSCDVANTPVFERSFPVTCDEEDRSRLH